MRVLSTCSLVLLAFACSSSPSPDGGASGSDSGRPASDGGLSTNRAGNIIVADQWNNRVIEIDPDAGAVVWSYGDGKVDDGGNPIATATSVISPNDAERLPSGDTLICGSGAPPASAGGEPACANSNGCQDNRVVVVDLQGNITWQYGQLGVAGDGANQLNVPVAAVLLSNGHFLITDQGNQRIIEVTDGGSIVWQYGSTGNAGPDAGLLNNPNSAERLENGDTLIADESNNRVIEIAPDGGIVWQYGSPNDTTTLNGAAFASRLPNGNTLISDSNNSRVIEVAPDGGTVWSYNTSTRAGSITPPTLVSHAVRLANGNTLITDQANNQIIEVNQAGSVVYGYGEIGPSGAGIAPGELNWPYSSTVVGDYTGLTPPN